MEFFYGKEKISPQKPDAWHERTKRSTLILFGTIKNILP